MKLITVTLNPAVDATVTLDRLERGYVHRAKSIRHDAGARASTSLPAWRTGAGRRRHGLLGRENAGVFEALFRAKRIEDRFVRRRDPHQYQAGGQRRHHRHQSARPDRDQGTAD